VPVTVPVNTARTLRSGETLPFNQNDGFVDLTLPYLKEYEAVVLETS
jgi:hypothetical protein